LYRFFLAPMMMKLLLLNQLIFECLNELYLMITILSAPLVKWKYQHSAGIKYKSFKINLLQNIICKFIRTGPPNWKPAPPPYPPPRRYFSPSSRPTSSVASSSHQSLPLASSPSYLMSQSQVIKSSNIY
jgi:hypothetical protein